MIKYLSLEQVIKIHDQQIRCPVRDFSALASAVDKPRAGYAGIEIYQTLPEKGAALLGGLAMNHPFVDGNKRTSWMSTVVFLRLNGLKMAAVSDDDVVEFMVAVIEDNLHTNDIARWLNDRIQ